MVPVRQASVLLTASFGFGLATGTLAVRLALPLAGCALDFNQLVTAPCRAHVTNGRPGRSPVFLALLDITGDERYCLALKNMVDEPVGTLYGDVAPVTVVHVAPAPTVGLCSRVEPVNVIVSGDPDMLTVGLDGIVDA